MNELDKRIAELKGFWWDLSEGVVWITPPVPVNQHGIVDGGRRCLSIGDFCYSTDDAKALELVDELAPVTAGSPEWGFMCGCFGKEWNATFYRSVRTKPHGEIIVHPDHQFEGDAPTRPEAICRAYIAAREWMATREVEFVFPPPITKVNWGNVRNDQ
jgi:hypothetical protein